MALSRFKVVENKKPFLREGSVGGLQYDGIMVYVPPRPVLS
jgi:hypothetical protein